jgi:hypothetical protein
MQIGTIEHDDVTWVMRAQWRHQSRSKVPAIDLLFEPMAASHPFLQPLRIQLDRAGVQMLTRRRNDQDLEYFRRYLIQALRAAGI